MEVCGVDIDFSKKNGYFINADCMEGMKLFPDDYFDLAIVDPPYGSGLTENGGCKGWFSKYHQNPETLENAENGGVLEQIWWQVRQVQTDITTSEYGNAERVTRTGGSWSKKYGKKSLRGMLPRKKSILKSFFASHGIK